VLRERLRQIQKELGETDTSSAEIDEMKQPSRMPACRRRSRADRARAQASGAHAGLVRRILDDPTYLDWLLAMPWSKSIPRRSTSSRRGKYSTKTIMGSRRSSAGYWNSWPFENSIPRAAAPFSASSAPGVGKTSLGQSIAKAIGLKFGRVSLGGVHDEAEFAVIAEPTSDRCPATLCKLCARPPPQSRPHAR